VVVNCVENFTSKLIYEHILYSLQDEEEEEISFTTRCDNMVEFLRLLKQTISHRNMQDQTFYIILDKAERLRELEINILPAFLRLQELTKLNICVILLTEIIWEKFFSGTGFYDPVEIHFTDYSKADLQQIMCRDCPSDYPVELFGAFCQLLLSVFYAVCRDLNELRHLVNI
jgi:origin recognition complex subunit 5